MVASRHRISGLAVALTTLVALLALKDARIDPRPRSCEEIRRRP